MKTFRYKFVLLGGLLLASAANAQVVGYNFRTGDAWVDTRLVEINDYGMRYRDPFINEMTTYYGAPRSLVTDLFGRNWSAGDIFMACAIAKIAGVPCVNVVRTYEADRGQGWGNIAKRMGIKPGSPEFHRLKNGFSTTYDRWGYPVRVDSNVRVDWSKHGPNHNKGAAKAAGNGNASSKARVSDHGGHKADHPGGGKSTGAAKGKGQGGGNKGQGGNGKGKGHGKD